MNHLILGYNNKITGKWAIISSNRFIYIRSIYHLSALPRHINLHLICKFNLEDTLLRNAAITKNANLIF